DFEEGRFAVSGGPNDVKKLPRLDAQIDVVENERLGVGVAVAHVAKLDDTADRLLIRPILVVTPLERGECDVGKALEVQPEDTEIKHFLDQETRPLDELLLVTHEGEDHSDGEDVVERKSRGKIDGDHVLESENGVVDGLEADLRSTEPHVGIHEIRIAVEPLPLALVLTVGQLQGLYGPQRLDKGRVFPRLALDDGLAVPAEHTEESEPHRRIQQEREQYDESQGDAVNEHHRQRQNRHETVDKPRDQSLRQHVANGLDRPEARENVADVPFLEEGEWQAHEMMEEPRADLEAQCVLHDEHDERADRGRGDPDQSKQRKPERKDEEQIDVSSGDDLVHRQLHVEWSGDDEEFQDPRQNEDLDERVGAPAHPAPKRRERKPQSFVLLQELVGRREFECHAAQVL